MGRPLDQMALWMAQVLTGLAEDAHGQLQHARAKEALYKQTVEQLKRERRGLSIMGYRTLAHKELAGSAGE